MKKVDNKYIGCNLCRSQEAPTEQFEGFCGNVLWFCESCTKKLKQESFKPVVRGAKK